MHWRAELPDILLRQLVDEHRRRLKVNALVLEAHEQGPVWTLVLANGAAQISVGHALDQPAHRLVHLLAVGVHLLDRGPGHAVFRQVVPRHLVHARLEDAFEMRVDGLG